MAIRFGINVDGAQILARAFDRFDDAVDDWTPAWEEARDFLYEWEQEVFDSRGFGTWPDKADGTAATLIQSERLIESLTGAGGDNIAVVGSESLAFGSRVVSPQGAPYPLFHQRGTTRMPQRRVIFLEEGARRDILKIFQRHAVAKMTAAFSSAGGAKSVSGF